MKFLEALIDAVWSLAIQAVGVATILLIVCVFMVVVGALYMINPWLGVFSAIIAWFVAYSFIVGVWESVQWEVKCSLDRPANDLEA